MRHSSDAPWDLWDGSNKMCEALHWHRHITCDFSFRVISISIFYYINLIHHNDKLLKSSVHHPSTSAPGQTTVGNKRAPDPTLTLSGFKVTGHTVKVICLRASGLTNLAAVPGTGPGIITGDLVVPVHRYRNLITWIIESLNIKAGFPQGPSLSLSTAHYQNEWHCIIYTLSVDYIFRKFLVLY